jgi:DNA-binding response OmpR family regulator
VKMGGMDGLQVMREIAKMPRPPAVIMLTAHSSLDSAVALMRQGGDDYLTKPCRTEDLLESIQRCLKKRQDSMQRHQLIEMIASAAQKLQSEQLPEPAPVELRRETVQSRGLHLHLDKELVTRAGKPLALTPTEFKLLACLMENTDRPVSCRALVAAIHGLPEIDIDEREARQSISTHVWRLRQKLGNAPDGAPYVLNVRGRAYKFVSKWESEQPGAG